jgi:glycosyltransferase involved in cell wall biosynthesis
MPSAEWIPDFQYRHFADGSNAAEVAGRKAEFADIIENAQHIVLSSACAEQDCHAELPASAGRTSVLRFRTFIPPEWLGDDPLETVRRLPDRFALISNILSPTKNHAVALQALSRLAPEDRAGLHIVCTGDIHDYRNPHFYDAFFAAIHTLGLRDRVSILGMIPKRQQLQLLRASLAYLQPSLFEGWNTGVEEAHMLGKPLLISDIPVHREQSPPGADFFDPRDPDQLGERLRRMSDAPGGFDPDRERGALSAYQDLQREFGRQFLRLAGVPQQS